MCARESVCERARQRDRESRGKTAQPVPWGWLVGQSPLGGEVGTAVWIEGVEGAAPLPLPAGWTSFLIRSAVRVRDPATHQFQARERERRDRHNSLPALTRSSSEGGGGAESRDPVTPRTTNPHVETKSMVFRPLRTLDASYSALRKSFLIRSTVRVRDLRNLVGWWPPTHKVTNPTQVTSLTSGSRDPTCHRPSRLKMAQANARTWL